jgi:hypothetical protein
MHCRAESPVFTYLLSSRFPIALAISFTFMGLEGKIRLSLDDLDFGHPIARIDCEYTFLGAMAPTLKFGWIVLGRRVGGKK